ncbi:HNH endonuclease signature motif containing protein [Bacillus toyonensis]|uniref:HNH endonuclease signature motif containing protein n=1 Tax=Bacillus toyonensis TaxID=155322 RepID=UPI000BF30706|nr:HNH endonuclease signature motif containing protein [Bacillus toyonensis]PGF00848.1 hypothetical protein COM61_22600 [Bacillus toyonensis]PHE47004.1 hypothetical protein COF71_13695 [Bacillus toyonensis]
MTKVITVTRKNGDVYEILVDKDLDIPARLYISGKEGNFYASFTMSGKNNYLHRWVANAPRGSVVDHINGNTFDNRKENLRVCTQQQNIANTIKYKGYKESGCKKKPYETQIKANGQYRYLGMYETKEEAQQVYRKAHAEAFGEYSPYYKYDSGITKEEDK